MTDVKVGDDVLVFWPYPGFDWIKGAGTVQAIEPTGTCVVRYRTTSGTPVAKKRMSARWLEVIPREETDVPGRV